MRVIAIVGMVLVAAIAVSFTSRPARCTDTEVSVSTDGGHTWSSVATSVPGSATGFVYVNVIDATGKHRFGVAQTESGTLNGAATYLWRVHEDFIPSTDIGTFNTEYGSGNELTLSWDEDGNYVGIE